jgi:uncharacterized protein YjiK
MASAPDAAPAPATVAATTLRLRERRQAPRGVSALLWQGPALWMVHDDKGVFVVDGELVAGPTLHPLLGDLEGMTRDDDGGIVVVAEESGQLLRVLGARVTLVGQPLRSLLPAAKENKGFEGVAFMPARFSSHGPRWLVVHEKSPKVLMVLDAQGAWQASVPLPPAIDAALGDLSDVAVDPQDGRIWLLSDKTETVVVARLIDSTLTEAEVLPLTDVADGAKPEAITFGPDGTLWLGTDGSKEILAYDVSRKVSPSTASVPTP